MSGEDWIEIEDQGGHHHHQQQQQHQQQKRKMKQHFWRPKNNQQQLSSRLQGRLTYEPPRLNDLQQQNRAKARKYFPKKKPPQPQPPQEHPHAPRNTSSFIMRAKLSGGIAPPTPTPSTPAVLSTPDLSAAGASYREGITEEVNKEWGVNGYGSMNGLIRLRASSEDNELNGRVMNELSDSDSDVDQGQGVESVQELELRLDQDLNRFEIVYPAGVEAAKDGFMITGTQLVDQESHIAHLEEENLTLKERIYILEQQIEELKQQNLSKGGGESLDEMEVCSGKSVEGAQ